MLSDAGRDRTQRIDAALRRQVRLLERLERDLQQRTEHDLHERTRPLIVAVAIERLQSARAALSLAGRP